MMKVHSTILIVIEMKVYRLLELLLQEVTALELIIDHTYSAQLVCDHETNVELKELKSMLLHKQIAVHEIKSVLAIAPNTDITDIPHLVSYSKTDALGVILNYSPFPEELSIECQYSLRKEFQHANDTLLSVNPWVTFKMYHHKLYLRWRYVNDDHVGAWSEIMLLSSTDSIKDLSIHTGLELTIYNEVLHG
jgi:hypothetical protein